MRELAFSFRGLSLNCTKGTVNMIEKKRCYFWIDDNYCGILSETRCNGQNDRCTFRKTAAEFVRDADNAIMINREKGNCEKCKYRPFNKCNLSTESIDTV